ncbi:MAG: DNA-processing protein DprA [Acidobacteriota bacterium]
MHVTSALAALRLHLCPFTPRQRTALRELLPDPDALLRAGPSALAPVRPSVALRDAWRRHDRTACERELDDCRKRDVRLLTRGSPDYPTGLHDLPDPPEVLWVRGTVPSNQRVPVTLVGPRRPSPYGIRVTAELGAELARRGACLVSGGARGLDAEAHRAALRVGAPTVVVLGCGVEVTYPPEHRRLFADVVEADGAVVSEHPRDLRPRKHHFPIRNRLLAAWGRAVVLPEAALRSGSLVTARLALELGREVLAVPGPITAPTSEGTHALLRDGAALLRGADDLLAELRPEDRTSLTNPEPEKTGCFDGDPGLLELLALFPADRAVELDEIAEFGRFSGSEVARAAIRLEALGRLRSLSDGRWLHLAGDGGSVPGTSSSRLDKPKTLG